MRLVLAGGGVRGSFTAGVLAVLADARLPVTSVFGTSAGALNGAYFCTGQLDHMRRLWTDFLPTERFVSYRRALQGRPITDIDGLIDRGMGERYALDGRALRGGAFPFHTCATDLATGEPIVATPDATDVLDWLRASAAVPLGYHRTVRIGGRELVDGSLAAPLGCAACPPGPAEPVLIVLTLPLGHRRRPLHPLLRRASAALLGDPMTRLLDRYGPLYNAALDAALAATHSGRVALIAPDRPLPVSRITTDSGAIRESIRRGEEAARAFVRARWARQVRAAG